MNHMLRYMADVLQLPGVMALLQFVHSNPWPEFDVEFNRRQSYDGHLPTDQWIQRACLPDEPT